MKEPLISIVTISFNQGEFLERCILSVLNQSYKNIQYIVVDGGSTDNSRDIIGQYSSRINEIILEPDDGPADALNKGFRVATGEIFAFLNSDDEYLPFAISDLVSAMIASPEVDVMSGNALMVDAAGRLKRRVFSDQYSARRAARRGAYLMQPSTVFKASAFQNVGGFNPLNRATWDGELWMDMALLGAKFAKTEGYHSLYRVHGASITGSQRLISQSYADWRTSFFKFYKRRPNRLDSISTFCFKIIRHVRNPRGFFERLLYGRNYGF